VKRLSQVALGIIASFGGFVDTDELVFNTGAGAHYGYALLWALVVGIVGIMVYGEMSGRVSVVTRRPLMALVRERYGPGFGAVTLIAEQFVIVMSLCAQLGGIALVLQFVAVALPFRLLLTFAMLGFAIALWFLPFDGIERVFGYIGVGLVIFWVTALDKGPNWHAALNGLVPHGSYGDYASTVTYWFFAIGVIGAALIPFKLAFFSSGAIEEQWEGEDGLTYSRDNALIGFGLGGLLAAGLIFCGAEILSPHEIHPQYLSTIAFVNQIELGRWGLYVAGAAMLFAIAGAAAESVLAASYNWTQFFGWEWGKDKPRSRTRKFIATYMVLVALAFVVDMLGANPVLIVDYAVPLSALGLPLSYLATLLVARDPHYMGAQANGRLANGLGWLYLMVAVAFSVVAIPLLIMSNHGAK
jgi:Mn2+/Fe2+ NRAMP family transporter